MNRLGLAGALLIAGLAHAHPMSRDKYSFRTAIRLDGAELDALVVLEVPFDVVMGEVNAALGAAGVDAKDAASAPEARKILDQHTRRVWDRMADHLLLLIDDRPVAGAWKPADNRYNGKGAVTEGFFMYIVEFEPTNPIEWTDAPRVRVMNVGWPDAPMTYSAFVTAGKGWSLARSSTEGILPKRSYDLNDPAFWVGEPALRVVSGTFQRATP